MAVGVGRIAEEHGAGDDMAVEGLAEGKLAVRVAEMGCCCHVQRCG